MRASIDIETALYELLESDGYSASAHAIPATLGQTLPHVHVVRTGGSTIDMVIDSHYVDFDVYAADQAESMNAASNLCAWIRDLWKSDVETPCYKSETMTLPYGNPDPRHPNIPRTTVKAIIVTRTAETEGPRAKDYYLVADTGEDISANIS